jgi:ferredoxin-NADP reductase
MVIPFQLTNPGQYITIRTSVSSLYVGQPRQYTLSDSPGDCSEFRISVKREPATKERQAGIISNILHDSLPEKLELDVSMPFGTFVLDVEDETPVVLISAGVGITPMMAMLKAIVSQPNNPRRVTFIHAARNKLVHAMGGSPRQIIASSPHRHKISHAIWYKGVNPATDVKGVDYDFEGRVNLKLVKEMVVLPEANYYLCGPIGFMNCQKEVLLEMGVRKGRVRDGFFGVMCDKVLQTGRGLIMGDKNAISASNLPYDVSSNSVKGFW